MLDVFDEEPLEKDSPLSTLSGAYLTPHRGDGINESIIQELTMLADDLEAVFAGQEQKCALTEAMMVSLPE